METSEKLDLLLKFFDSLREAHWEMSKKFQQLEKEVGGERSINSAQYQERTGAVL